MFDQHPFSEFSGIRAGAAHSRPGLERHGPSAPYGSSPASGYVDDRDHRIRSNCPFDRRAFTDRGTSAELPILAGRGTGIGSRSRGSGSRCRPATTERKSLDDSEIVWSACLRAPRLASHEPASSRRSRSLGEASDDDSGLVVLRDCMPCSHPRQRRRRVAMRRRRGPGRTCTAGRVVRRDVDRAGALRCGGIPQTKSSGRFGTSAAFPTGK